MRAEEQVQQRCSGETTGCLRCKQASSACIYPLLDAQKGPKRRKRSDSIRNIQNGNLPSSEDEQVGKCQKISPRNSSPGRTEIGELGQNAAPTGLDQTGAPAQSLPESFTLPEGFLDGVLPDSDLQSSENFLTNLNFDHYFTYGFSTADLTPESQNLGKRLRSRNHFYT